MNTRTHSLLFREMPGQAVDLIFLHLILVTSDGRWCPYVLMWSDPNVLHLDFNLKMVLVKLECTLNLFKRWMTPLGFLLDEFYFIDGSMISILVK